MLFLEHVVTVDACPLPSPCMTLMTGCSGTKHRGLKPGQRKELLASAKEKANELQKGVKDAVKS